MKTKIFEKGMLGLGLISLVLFFACKEKSGSPNKTPSPTSGVNETTLQTSAKHASPPVGNEIRITARVAEIPGTFPANDVYNYVYVMRYDNIKVESGSFSEKDILIGHYNPLILRKEIKDDLDSLVDGDITGFEIGAIHHLVLRPLESVYSGAIEDDFFRDTRPRWFATRVTRE